MRLRPARGKVMQRPTEMYPRAWIAHTKLQWGRNWRYVSHKFVTRK